MTMSDRRRRHPHAAVRASKTRLSLLAWIVIAGCASKPLEPTAADLQPPRSVAIIPVQPSEYLTLDRRSLMIGGILVAIERLDRYGKQKDFVAQFDADRAAIADALTASLLAAARRRGFDAFVLADTALNPEDPEDFEYAAQKTEADVLVQVHLRDVGVFNRLTSFDYEPNVDTRVHVVVRKTGYPLVDESFHYGVDAKREAFWSVPSDPTDRWPNFESVMANREAIETSWKKGAEALGERIIEQIPSSVAR